MYKCIFAVLVLSFVLGCGVGSDGALAQSDVPVPESDVRARRLWAGSDSSVYVARAPSPDGRYVLEADGYGDFGIRNLADGSWHQLAEGGPNYVLTADFSPDGDRVAAFRYDSDTEGYDLWTYDLQFNETGIPGLANETFVATGLAPSLFGWTEADEILTAIWRPDDTLALVLVSPRTGSMRVVKSLRWREPGAAITSDGSLIAYDHIPEADSDERDIFLISNEAEETTLVSGPGDDTVLGWIPGTADLLFLSDRSGSRSIWRIRTEGGRPSGSPVLVREDAWNLQGLGFSGDAFYFQSRVDQPRYATALVDLETESLLPLPVEFVDEKGGRIRMLEWSPDGEFVVHDAVRPGAGLVIVVRTAEGQVIREWEFDLTMSRMGLRWTPDGRAIILNAFGGEALRRIDLDSGEVETIRRFPDGERNDGNPGGFAVSPDGRTLAFAYHVNEWVEPAGHPVGTLFSDDSVDSTIVLRDFSTGEERTLARLDGGGSLEFSPDGAWLAALTSGATQRLLLHPSSGGEPRVLYSAADYPGSAARGIVGWSPDSAWVYFNVRPGPDQPGELWRAPVDGGEPRVAVRGMTADRLHPDGRRLAFRTGSLELEIWAMDRFGVSDDSAVSQ